uniref:Uncharacterized protein n=1 Tax=Setaria viridis TaxID=4556 RepID=A0A4U6UFH8_SETVI|nr:hypothetical protein SEVIR_5G096650v2 [Setaria viridis]
MPFDASAGNTVRAGDKGRPMCCLQALGLGESKDTDVARQAGSRVPRSGGARQARSRVPSGAAAFAEQVPTGAAALDEPVADSSQGAHRSSGAR